ncbi:signal transduction histidine kinase [Crenobacter luteus]|uniref:PAS-domain containing protein n=1 Tax=Crenobacter luteus TaxID=1452487 RepID=UPI00104B9B94|nr:PAS-domain containing protein [Crenobacter luteus]TCP08465.1 signal transduction histidine kinase [Crenobacter luteus]
MALFRCLRSPERSTIRFRLVAAFLLLFCVTLAVATVGVLGMRANQRTLDEFEASVVPEIARVLELSEKVAQVAAIAPGMTGTASPDLLHDNTELLQSLLGDIRRLSSSLPARAEEKLAVAGELDGIDRDLTRLMALARASHAQQQVLRAQRRALDEVGRAIFLERSAVARETPTLLNLWVTLSAASAADGTASLGRFESDAEALWAQAESRGETRRRPALAAELGRLADPAGGVLATRRGQLVNEQDTGYVVALMRAHADQLGVRAARYVRELREIAAQRRARVHIAVASGESSLLLLAGGGVVLALFGVFYVGRVLTRLQAMTGVMARLAAGDTGQLIPATERCDEVGDLARAFQVFRDTLLDKQRLAQGLDAQRRLLETVFQSMSDGLSVYDAAGRLVAWNPTFVRLLELPAGFVRPGMSLAELRHGVPRASRWRAVSRDTATRTEDGRTRIAASAELHLSGGCILEFQCQGMPDGGWVAVCRDLSSRRAVEAELRQAQKMEVLGQLTGGVAHDFNNFLVAILGNLELLQARLAGEPDSLALAERARRAAERASQLTRRLLAFARRQPLTPELVEVGAMLAEMQDLVEYCVGDAIRVVIEPVVGQPTVRVDRGQLENAVFNLALNSAAAMPDGGTLTLSAARVEQPSHLPGCAAAVVLRVADTGTGIPPALLSKVVEPFFTTKAPGEGSGLGLSMVYGFARQSGGDLAIDSVPGAGTTVSVWLPAGEARAERGARSAPVAAPARPGATVLVVEDDDAVRETTLSMLATLGAVADGVADADAALAWLAGRGPVALVLSDISLGAGGDGVVLARRIRERWPSQEVVLTSGLPLESHLARADWHPGQRFVAKPFSLPTLAGLFA